MTLMSVDKVTADGMSTLGKSSLKVSRKVLSSIVQNSWLLLTIHLASIQRNHSQVYLPVNCCMNLTDGVSERGRQAAMCFFRFPVELSDALRYLIDPFL